MNRNTFNFFLLLALMFTWHATPAFSAPATYQYDSLNRLTRSININGAVTTYEYDAAGNRTRVCVTTGALDIPTAGFTADTTSGTAPLHVTFTDTSTGIVEFWNWDFGDGNTSVEQNPTHTYTESGAYTVTLTAANRDGQDVITQADYITVTSFAGPQPRLSISHGFQPGSNGIIDFSGDRLAPFRITLQNTGQLEAVADVGIDLMSNGFIMVSPPENCIYDDVSHSFKNITVLPDNEFIIDYTVRYEGQETANGAEITVTARLKRIKEWYDEASGLNLGGYANLTAAATAAIQSQPMVLGFIEDMSTGAPIPNATITATGDLNTASAQDGSYSMAISPGVYDLTVSRYGYQTITIPTVIIRSNQATLLNIELTTPDVLSMTTTELPEGFVGQEQNPRIKVTGGTYPYTYTSVSGQLPPGVALNSSTGNLSGTPTTPGSYTFTIGVTDKNSGYVEREFTMQVEAHLSINTGAILPRAMVNESYTASFDVTGGTPPYTCGISAGDLPEGMNLSADGIISGIPAAQTESIFNVTAADNAGANITREFHLAVDEALVIGTERLFTGIVSRTFNQNLVVSGGYGNYTWSVTEGNLPAGITLQNQTGQLTGTPTEKGSGTVKLAVQDEQWHSVKECTHSVKELLSVFIKNIIT